MIWRCKFKIRPFVVIYILYEGLDFGSVIWNNRFYEN